MPRSPAVPRALPLALHHRQGCVPACVRARARHVSGRRARGTNRCAACVYARARAQGSRLRFLETHSSRSTRRRKLRGAFRESNDLFFLSLFFFLLWKYGNMQEVCTPEEMEGYFFGRWIDPLLIVCYSIWNWYFGGKESVEMLGDRCFFFFFVVENFIWDYSGLVWYLFFNSLIRDVIFLDWWIKFLIFFCVSHVK